MSINNRWKVLLFMITSLFFINACTDPGEIGMELLPSGDLINVGNRIEKERIKAYTFIDDSVRTDGSNMSLLGSFKDPVFGTSTVDLAFQLRLASYPGFKEGATADSIKFFFYYFTVYGDTSTVQKLRFYELTETLDPDARFYDNHDLSQYASSVPLAEFNFKPKVALDSVYKDTIYQLVAVNMDMSLAQKLISADTLDMVNNEAFLNYFKGLYIKPEPVQQGGAIVSVDMIPTANFLGSALVLYYTNPGDTVSKSHAYYITSFSSRVNSFKHDYSQTAFYPKLNKETSTDSLIYIQSIGGLQSKLHIPGLEEWRDSSEIAINKAELVFHIDTTASDFRKYPLPNQLLLTYINKDGVETLPRDHAFYPLYYGGYLQSDYTYRFNITQHLQSILTKETGKETYVNDNNGFFLTPFNKNDELRRVVLKGSGSKQGITFTVTYSKLMQ
jgi:hypothetical protein